MIKNDEMSGDDMDCESVSSHSSPEFVDGSVETGGPVAFHRARVPSRAFSEPPLDDSGSESSFRDTSPLLRRTHSVDSQFLRLSRTSMPSILMGRGIAKTPEERCIDASVYIQEGEDNDKFHTHPTTPTAMTAYRLLHNHVAWSLDLAASIVILVVAIAEYPSVFLDKELFNFTKGDDTHYRDSYFLPFHTVIEMTCLAILFVLLLLRMRWVGVRNFFHHVRSVLKLILIIIMYIEVIVILIRFRNHIRVTRALRPVFLLDSHYCYGVRRMTRQIFQSLPPILDMIILLIAFILAFALLGYFIFIGAENSVFFVDLWTSFVSLFILLTTANYPTVMMPVYSEYWWAPIFFIAFLCITLYLIMNLLLAVVYSTFSSFEKEKYRKLFLHKREALCRAYDVLCGSKPMKLDHFRGIMKFYRPRWKDIRVLCCFKALDSSCSGSLSLQEFLHFYDVIHMSWKQYSELEGEVRWYSWIKTKGIRKFFRRMTVLVQHKAFKYIINFSLLCFAAFLIYVAVEAGKQKTNVNMTVDGNWTLVNERCVFLSDVNAVYWINVAFLILYSVEAFLKLVGLGPTAYFTDPWNIFDFLCVLLSGIGMTYDRVQYKSHNVFHECKMEREATDWLRYVLYARVIRIFRLLQIKKRYRDVLGTLFSILPRMFNVGVLIILLYYFFAIIGMECFAFDIGPGPGCCRKYWTPAFNVETNYNGNASYPNKDTYYLNNFNNILRSYVLLFELMIVNNWYIPMNGFTSASGTQYTRIYFMIFFVVSVIIVAVVISFILDAFLFRMESYDKAPGQVFGEGFDVIDVRISADEFQEVCQRKPVQIIGNVQGGYLRYKGKRKKTKGDFRMQMYAEEVKAWVEEQDEELNRERSIAASAGQLTTMTHDQLLLDGPNLIEDHFSGAFSVSMRSADAMEGD